MGTGIQVHLGGVYQDANALEAHVKDGEDGQILHPGKLEYLRNIREISCGEREVRARTGLKVRRTWALFMSTCRYMLLKRRHNNDQLRSRLICLHRNLSLP